MEQPTLIDPTPAEGPEAPLTCPCGSTVFDVGQYTWNTQQFDAGADDWGSSDYSYEDEIVVHVKCADCETDVTDQAIAKGWRIFHDHALLRAVRRTGTVPMPPIHITGRNGESKKARLELTDGGALELWRGWSNEQAPLLTIDICQVQRGIELTTMLLELLLDRQLALQAAAKPEG